MNSDDEETLFQDALEEIATQSFMENPTPNNGSTRRRSVDRRAPSLRLDDSKLALVQ